MIKGIGIDIVELDRIEKIVMRTPKFVDRILTIAEKLEFETLSESRKIEFLAGRFAAKEAFAKAVGTGIGSEWSFLDIEVGRDKLGKPYIVCDIDSNVHLSISHSKQFAVAQVILEEKLK